MRESALALCLMLAGCAANSEITDSTIGKGLSKYKTAFIEVDTRNSEYKGAVPLLKSSLVGKMAAASCFENYVTGAEPGKAELKLTATITGVRSVSSTGRFFFGAMAWKASVQARIKLIDLKTGDAVGAFNVEGKSSGGSVVAGTTSEAFEKTGEGVAQFINENK
jgi:hypothetical protein